MTREGDGSADVVGMPVGAAWDVPVCLDLGTASVTAIEKKKKNLDHDATSYCVGKGKISVLNYLDN